MTPLLLLAEKVEGLSGPDREVDVRISLALCGVAHTDDDVADLLRVHDEPTGYGKYRHADDYVLRYTVSLDAALTLVIKNRFWMVDNFDGPEGDRCHSASVFYERGKPYAEYSGCAATPALALVAASLRARAAMEAGE